jgi:hypothetical protein
MNIKAQCIPPTFGLIQCHLNMGSTYDEVFLLSLLRPQGHCSETLQQGQKPEKHFEHCNVVLVVPRSLFRVQGNNMEYSYAFPRMTISE